MQNKCDYVIAIIVVQETTTTPDSDASKLCPGQVFIKCLSHMFQGDTKPISVSENDIL